MVTKKEHEKEIAKVIKEVKSYNNGPCAQCGKERYGNILFCEECQQE